MTEKEQLAENIAEDLIFSLKSMFPTDLTYTFLNEETGNLELKYAPKGEVLKNKFIKTILTHIE
jgi:hypothetical protein